MKESIEEYLLRLRSLLGVEYYIIVPNTEAYQIVVNKMNDEYILFKEPGMDYQKYARLIKR